jgi:hypothetical protein
MTSSSHAGNTAGDSRLNPLPSLADADLLGVFSGGAGACEYRRASLLKVAFAAKKGDNEEEAFM